MPQPACEPIEATIQQMIQDLSAIDDQLQALESEGMNQQLPWAYFVLQRQVDRLIHKKQGLQDAWNRAMNELAICRLGQSWPHDPRSSSASGRTSPQSWSAAP